jgi:predicted RNase H-like nuclease (RuvC/YqgF family)
MESNTSDSKKIYVAMIVILLLINGVAGYLLFKENKEKQIKIDEVTKLDSDYKSLNADFEAAKAEIELYKGKNEQLDSILSERQQKIERYQSQLAQAQKKGKLNEEEIKKFKSYISELQADNAKLQEQVTDLTAKNQILDQSLTAEKQTTAALSEERVVLSKKVELGSLLQLQNVKVEGIMKRNSGKEVVKSSTKRVDYLKISFSTGNNKVLEAGTLSLYVRIMNPKGETIMVPGQDSGVLKLADGGGEVQFSKKIDTDWNKENKNLTLEWSQGIEAAGNYNVEFYQSGYLVGKGAIALK